ncbi:MAG: RNA-protein complex protein Nop10 [bacterium]|nr:RNA-protein complex protein Nop10 [bacterium]
MRWRLRKCTACGAYTLLEQCPYCGGKTKIAHPPRFSPIDRYGKYRRLLKLEVEKYQFLVGQRTGSDSKKTGEA